MKDKTGDSIKKFFKIIFGLLLIVAGIMTYFFGWWPQLLDLIKGSLGIFLVLIGLMFVFIGISE